MSRVEGSENVPRAMIHRRILDVAASNPDASIPTIAEEVSAASPELVDKVLEEYGDPAAESEQSTEASESTMATENGSTETVGGTETDEPAVTLSDKQRTTLGVVHENPGGSQGDIADELGVTRATVSRRLNSIPGFEWSEREAFAESVFDEPSQESAGQSPNDHAEHDTVTETEIEAESNAEIEAESNAEIETKSGDEPAGEVEVEDESEATSVSGTESTPEEGHDADGAVETSASTSRADAEPPLNALEQRVAALETTTQDDANAAPLPPDLAHKVVHACMESDRVSEEEELELLRILLAD